MPAGSGGCRNGAMIMPEAQTAQPSPEHHRQEKKHREGLPHMKALVLERKGELSLRDIDLSLEVGPDDVKIAIHTVGICGSDIHYYTHGRIGHYVVDAPMVLGHEAAGTIVEVGSHVVGLNIGDRVCMEPG